VLSVFLEKVELSMGCGEIHVQAVYAVHATLKEGDEVEKAVARWIAGKKDRFHTSGIDICCVDNRIFCSFVRVHRIITSTELHNAIDAVESITQRINALIVEAKKVFELVSKFDDIGAFVEVIRNLKEEKDGNQAC